MSVVLPRPEPSALAASYVRQAYAALAAAGLTGEVVVVDDEGGAACRAGLAASRGRYLVAYAAAAPYDFAELARLVAPLASGRADCAIGPGVGRAFTRAAYERAGPGLGLDMGTTADSVPAAAAQAELRVAVVPPGDRSGVGFSGRSTAPGTAPGALDNHLGGADAANYRAYELELVAPHCGRHVLEIGSGLGGFAEQLAGLAGVERLTVSDSDPMCLAALAERFAGRRDLELSAAVDVRQLDVSLPLPLPLAVPPQAPGHPRDGLPPVDTVVMMNVLEHVSDDVGALRRLSQVVVPGGRLVIWVPGYEALYGEFDRAVGHVRRYTPATVRRVAEFAGLTVEAARPVNLLGGLAWWLAVRLGGQQTPDPRWVRTYDRLVVPATRAVERVVRVPFGQSVLCVARVPTASADSARRVEAIPAQGARATG